MQRVWPFSRCAALYHDKCAIIRRDAELPAEKPQKTLIDELPSSPDYGKGAGFRRVELINSDGRVDVHLADLLHEMRLVLHHDGTQVTAIAAQFIRYPTNLCPGATASLALLEGTPIGTPAHKVGNGGIARLNCTHLYDLSALAIAHAGRSVRSRCYDATVPDPVDGRTTVSVARDGEIVHRWTLDGDVIVAPSDYAGQPIKAGFFKWAPQHLDDDALEAAIVMAKTVFISAGRRILQPSLTGVVLERNVQAHGVCFAYQPERIADGYFVGGNMRQTLDEALKG